MERHEGAQTHPPTISGDISRINMVGIGWKLLENDKLDSGQSILGLTLHSRPVKREERESNGGRSRWLTLSTLYWKKMTLA